MMFNLFKTIPLLLTGAALYHLSCTLLNQRHAQVQAVLSRQKEVAAARQRRLYRLAVACQRGGLN
jgi:hypothetical protein